MPFTSLSSRNRRSLSPALLAAALLLAPLPIRAQETAIAAAEAVSPPAEAGKAESSASPSEATTAAPEAASPQREDDAAARPVDGSDPSSAKSEGRDLPARAAVEPPHERKAEDPAGEPTLGEPPAAEAVPPETATADGTPAPDQAGTPPPPAAPAVTPTPNETSAAEAAAAAAARIAPPGTTQPRWIPLDIGNQWTYVYLRERERTRGGAEPEFESFRGTLIEEVVGSVPELSARAVEVRSTVRGHTEGAPSETVEQRRSFVESNGFSYRVLAVEAEDPLLGKLELTRFSPPLLTLKAGAGVGEKWRIGEKKTGGLVTELEGEVLGVQDAKVPVGVFEKCLVVQYRGFFSGAIEVHGNRIEVPTGTLVTTEWYAPGVGKVLAKEEIKQTMVLADGSILDYNERTQFALRSQKTGVAQSKSGDGD